MVGAGSERVAVPGVSSASSNISSSVQELIKAKGSQMSPSNYVSPLVHKNLQSGEESQPYNPAAIMPATFSSAKDSGLVLFTLAVLGFTLYLSYHLWRRHRCRTMAALSKGCQYSRLNQVETDESDSVVFCSEALQEAPQLENTWGDNCKPATLEVITDSLITTSNYSSNIPNGQSVSSLGSDLSDEDLLQ